MTKLKSNNIVIKYKSCDLVKAIYKAHENMITRVNHDPSYKNVTIEEYLLDRENWKEFCLDNGFYVGCSVSRRQDVGDYERTNITFSTKAQNRAGGFYLVTELETGRQHVLENLFGWCRNNNLKHPRFISALRNKTSITCDGLYKVQKFQHNYKENHKGKNFYFIVDIITGKKTIVDNLTQWCVDNKQDHKYISGLHKQGKYFSKEGRYKVIKLSEVL